MTDGTTPWYFVDDGAARGPVSRSELEELFDERALGAENFVWCPELEGWTPPADVNALRDVVPDTPPPPPSHMAGVDVSLEDRVSAAHRAHLISRDALPNPPSLPPEVPGTAQEVKGSSTSKSAIEPGVAPSDSAGAEELTQNQAAGANDRDTHAWRRLFARQLDYLMWGLPGGALVGFVLAAYSPEVYLQSLEWSNQAWAIVAAAAWVPVEAFLLAWFGWTPGKWLLAVEVRPKGGRSFRYGETLKRAADVWCRGVGLGIPLVAMITQLVAANKLNKNGETSWDKSHRFRVRCGKLKAGRVIGAIVIALLLFASFGALSSV